YDRDHWERLWARTLVEHGDKVARRPPNRLLTEVAGPLPAGRALDAGCGHGAESLWLAAHGWTVTGVDFSAAALAHARDRAATADLHGITWVEGDLSAWSPAPGAYDLVLSLYVHVPGSLEARVTR